MNTNCTNYKIINSCNLCLFGFARGRGEIFNLLQYLIFLHHKKHQRQDTDNGQHKTAPVKGIYAAHYGHKNANVIEHIKQCFFVHA